jgi:hypothetical protein
MSLYQRLRGIATEPQQIEQSAEISLIRDARGNWVYEDTGELYESVRDIEDGDEDADT